LQYFFNYIGNYERISRGSALKFGLIAEGLADLYPRFGETYEWDTAAGQCILEAAGGHVVDIQMQPLRYNTRPSLLNPHFIALGDGLNFLIEWSQRHGK
jgi:3'(2'), 5'-bisphosphate nucleotidase